MTTIPIAERRARLLQRHHLAAPATDVEAAAEAVVGLHATDPVSVFVAAQARCGDEFAPADLEAALYDTRDVARVLGMRRTMFVVPTTLVPVVHGAAARRYAAAERRRTVGMIEGAGIAADGDRWLRVVEGATLAALESRGTATAVQLSEDVPELKEKILVGVGKKWEGTIGVSTRVLFLLATEGRVVRGRPLGSWTSSQYRWAPARLWLGLDPEGLGPADAEAELARRWLRAFGPGTFDDLRWWSGWTVSTTRKALTALDVVEVHLDGATGVVLADDLTPVGPVEPTVSLLPALDPTVMGWKERAWYLGGHRDALFDRNGNAGPTVWWEGRVVGGWAQRPDGEVVFRLLEDVGAGVVAATERAAERLAQWLGEVRFVPRFRTPLERELSR